MVYPVFMQAKSAADGAVCTANAHYMSTALKMYATDYDQRFPPATSWQSRIRPYTKTPPIQCPARPRLATGYAFNSHAGGKSFPRIGEPHLLPLFFDSSLGLPDSTDALQSFVTPHRGLGTVNFADGHATKVELAPLATAGLAPPKPQTAPGGQ
jgi:prepilin-type processing-associated H-X9-DG protein